MSSPILVTGAHRSGTTWVGQSLAASPDLAYISEPLNVHHRPGLLPSQMTHWYTYVCAENEESFLTVFAELLQYRYHLGAAMTAARSGRDVLRIGRDLGILVRARLRKQRALVKDPFAVFSIEWFMDRLDFTAVALVRHPAAFVSSLIRLGWSFDFRDLLDQPWLMRDLLEPYRDRMRTCASGDIIDQGSLLWLMIYEYLDELRRRRPSICVVTHEELSRNPADGFRQLYGRLGLEFTESVERAILRSSSSENPSELSRGQRHSVRVDSRANIDNWKRRLTADEVARIRRVTEGAASKFYSMLDWN